MFPDWLPRLLEAVFYEKCEEHNSRDCTYFCIDCENPKSTCCEICASSPDNHHANREHLQVFKATYHPGVDIKIMNKYVDVSDIKHYIINNRRIVYIRKERTQKKSQSHAGLKNRCRSCPRGLGPVPGPGPGPGPDEALPPPKFCCLECKYDFLSERHNLLQRLKSEEEPTVGRRGLGPFEVGESSRRPPLTEKSCSNSRSRPKTDVHSFRRKPRKGIPRRSPFY